jgi:predicted nucleic acid-binding protein
VAGRVAFDTTFLIDLQRERSRGEPDGPAHRFLRVDPDLELHLSATALGEFAEGFDDSDDPVLRTVRELHVLLPIDEQTALAYGRVTRSLRQRGTLIGTNDLWIAAASLQRELPLVTANAAEFGRVSGLEVLAYR